MTADSIDATPNPTEFWDLFATWWNHLPWWGQIGLSFLFVWVVLTLAEIGTVRRTAQRCRSRLNDLEAEARRRDATIDRLRADLRRLRADLERGAR